MMVTLRPKTFEDRAKSGKLRAHYPQHVDDSRIEMEI